MNEYQKALMQAPSIEGDNCAICGKRPVERHHIVFRSQGGMFGATVPLCGLGNTSGCHGLAHAYRLHFRWVPEIDTPDGLGYWEYIVFDEPTKYEKALKQEGWEQVGKKPKHFVRSNPGLPDIPI